MKFFQKVREIRSRKGDLHFQRYAIFETPWASLYVHRIHRADQDPHLHSHPWNFATVVLRGRYWAKNEDGLCDEKKPGTFSHMTRGGFHKIQFIEEGPVTTLFFAYGKRKPWHYLVEGEHVLSDEYRERRRTGKL